MEMTLVEIQAVVGQMMLEKTALARELAKAQVEIAGKDSEIANLRLALKQHESQG